MLGGILGGRSLVLVARSFLGGVTRWLVLGPRWLVLGGCAAWLMICGWARCLCQMVGARWLVPID